MSGLAIGVAFVVLAAAVLTAVEARREGTSRRLVFWTFTGWAFLGVAALTVIVVAAAVGRWALS